MIAKNYDVDIAAAGQKKIAWARRSLPILAAIESRLTESKVVQGTRIGVSLVLEPKTANLVLALREAGAEVSVWAPAGCVKPDVVHALRASGIQVFADADADATTEADQQIVREFLATKPEILVDNGASVIRLIHKEFPELLQNMIGAVEETSNGLRALKAVLDAGELHLPVINVNDSRLKYQFDNVYGTGQSCVMAFLDVTNLQLAGRQVLVIGYGWVGKGIALHATAMGAKVTVAELNPIKCLQALHDGHKVKSIMQAAPSTEVVFAASGIKGAVRSDHLEAMADQVFLCTAGGGNFEMPMDYLHVLDKQTIRDEVCEYQLPNGKRVILVADGHCINCTAGEGNPIEIMDLSLSLQASAIEELAIRGENMPAGVHPVSEKIENTIALAQLKRLGAGVEPTTPELADAMKQW